MLADEVCLALLVSVDIALSNATNTPTEELASLIQLRKVIKFLGMFYKIVVVYRVLYLYCCLLVDQGQSFGVLCSTVLLV
jgi:hypothetical protein